MIVGFYGAAKTVTGSKHLLTLNSGKRILLDCGMFQGMGAKGYALNKEFLFDPSSINYLILSHAHLDHCGLIPLLVKKGFKGKIFCTPATRELAALVLEDSAKIQETENADKASGFSLYEFEDVSEALKRFEIIPYNFDLWLDDEIQLTFTDAGHILGSAVVNLLIKHKHRQKRICFTGDLGRYSNRILYPPQKCPDPDIIICESTYGDKVHSSILNTEDKIEKIVREVCLEKKGKVIIPAFSIGRTQELIYSLNILAEEKRLGDVPVFVDSPLSVYATAIVKEYKGYFNPSMKEYLQKDTNPFGFSNLGFIVDQDDSRLIQETDKPCVIISASGMMDAGRVQYHLKNELGDEKNAVLITGYCEPYSVGGQISAGAKEVEILGEMVPVNASIFFMKEYSAHADYKDLLMFLSNFDKEKIKHLYLVHGENNVMETFKEKLQIEGFKNIEIPDFRISYEV